MTARLRILVAVAIVFALAAHPLAHPMVKECPCTHAVSTMALEQAQSLGLELTGERTLLAASVHEAPAIASFSSRAPPAA